VARGEVIALPLRFDPSVELRRLLDRIRGGDFAGSDSLSAQVETPERRVLDKLFTFLAHIG
jgi:hypothetical protein